MQIRSARFRRNLRHACAGASSGAIVLLLAAPASALDLGGVSVRAPVVAPPVGSPTASAELPAAVRVAPIGVNAGKIAPGLGASLSVSPAKGVAGGVTLPTSVGPIALPPVPPVPGTPTVLGGAPVPPVPRTPQIGPPDAATGPSGSSASGSSAPGVTRDGKGSATARSSHPASAAGPGAHVSPGGSMRVASGARPAPDESPGSVTASVKHPAPEQSSNLWRAIDAVGSRQGLLAALLVLVLVARF
ncbi:MAG: hypothetical protein QOF59_346, partial [Actinomycetota bacterium]|nr:hypothetical protein [Actinomycetota bacterium]